MGLRLTAVLVLVGGVECSLLEDLLRPRPSLLDRLAASLGWRHPRSLPSTGKGNLLYPPAQPGRGWGHSRERSGQAGDEYGAPAAPVITRPSSSSQSYEAITQLVYRPPYSDDGYLPPYDGYGARFTPGTPDLYRPPYLDSSHDSVEAPAVPHSPRPTGGYRPLTQMCRKLIDLNTETFKVAAHYGRF